MRRSKAIESTFKIWIMKKAQTINDSVLDESYLRRGRYFFKT